jgi:hypothetical protein
LENTMNRTILTRLAALEARRPVERKPVDMRPVRARMNMLLIACHDGGKRPDESELIGFARALQFRNEAEMFLTAWNDRAEFVRRYIVAKPPCRAHQAQGEFGRQMRQAQDDKRAAEAGDVCDEVIRQCIALEMANQLVDVIFPLWRRPGVEPVEIDDAVASDIGRSLLKLAARRPARCV